MIRKINIIFCDNEHGSGDVCFPDVDSLDGHDLRQKIIDGNTIGSVRHDAKKAGWGRVNGGDYCPGCMDSMGN